MRKLLLDTDLLVGEIVVKTATCLDMVLFCHTSAPVSNSNIYQM